jgi:hypothetical protein
MATNGFDAVTRNHFWGMTNSYKMFKITYISIERILYVTKKILLYIVVL